MDKFVTDGRGVMEANPKLMEAAKAAVRDGEARENLIQLDGYPGMFVGKSDHPELQGLHFFEFDGVMYAIGPKMK